MATYHEEMTYDLNSIFHMNFNYNFDLLKTVLEGLLKRQKETSQAINDLNSANREKDEKIAKLEQDVLNLTNRLKENPGNSNIQRDEKSDKESKDTGQGKISEVKGVDDGVKLSVSVGNDEMINKLIKKINSIEQTVNDLTNTVNEVSKFKKPIQEHTEQLRQHDTLLMDLTNKLNQLKNKSDEHDRQIKDILVKMEDFNILEILKNANTGEGGDNSVTLGLLANLEKKLNQKIKFIEERTVKQDEEIFKIRTDLNNLKNAHDQTVRNVSMSKDRLDKNDNDIADLYSKIKQLENDLNGMLEKAFEDLKKLIDDKLKDIIASLEDKINDLNERMNNSQGKVGDSDQNFGSDVYKSIKDLAKRLSDLEKAVKLLPSQINIESVWKEINAMKESIDQKASEKDHLQLKELVAELQKQLNYLKDQLDTLIEDQSDHEEIQLIKKKLENLNNLIHSLKGSEHDTNYNNNNNNSSLTKTQIDTTKFVDIQVFNDFKSSVIKEFENVNDNLNQLKRLIDELINALKTKASFKDLKALEDDMIAKLEDLRLYCNKKFADKVDTAKNIKYLDQQIKHIIEIYIKKMDKGDNWLLAKKPLGGHLCASCETYIGDLKDNPQYIPWNKYPMRDPNDKLYRVGNGFSKMLQMITVDNASDRRDNNFQTTQDFYCNTYHEGRDQRDHSDPKNKGSLPKIIRPKQKLNLSNDEIMDNLDEIEREIDPNQPRITKIYKKNKKTEP